MHLGSHPIAFDQLFAIALGLGAALQATESGKVAALIVSESSVALLSCV
jgi:hypothetical protein